MTRVQPRTSLPAAADRAPRASARPPAARSRGFTLIEVILALALTTLLLGLLSSGVFIVAGDWNRNASLLDASLDQALTILQIDRALHGASRRLREHALCRYGGVAFPRTRGISDEESHC